MSSRAAIPRDECRAAIAYITMHAQAIGPRVRQPAWLRSRWVIWAFAIVLGVVIAASAQGLLLQRETVELEKRRELQVYIEGAFKQVYTQWLDHGGIHDVPLTQANWINLQKNLFAKWSSAKGDREAVGEGLGQVHTEISGAAGDPAEVRLPPDLYGRADGDALWIRAGCYVRLRPWEDGSVGWRVSFR